MGEGLDPYLVVMLFGLGLWLFFLVVVPPRIYREAWRNLVGRRGARSRLRLAELGHFADFAVGLLVIPVLFISLAGGAMLIVHEYVARIPLIEDVLNAFEADAVARQEEWVMYMEELNAMGVAAGPDGMVDKAVAYQWPLVADEIKMAPNMAGIFQDLLWRNWLPLAGLAVTGGLFFYWFMFRYHAVAVQRYYDGVLQRRGGRFNGSGRSAWRRSGHGRSSHR